MSYREWVQPRMQEYFNFIKEQHMPDYPLNEELKAADSKHYAVITRTALFYAGGVALYCTRMFTRASEQATDRVQTAVNQTKVLFDALDAVLKAGG